MLLPRLTQSAGPFHLPHVLSWRASSPEDSQTGGRVPVQSVQHPRAQAPEELLQIPALQVCSVQPTPRRGALHHLRDARVRNATRSGCHVTPPFSFRSQIHGPTVTHLFSGFPFHVIHLLFLPKLTDFFLSCLLSPLWPQLQSSLNFQATKLLIVPYFQNNFVLR